MSRIGKQPILLPSGISARLEADKVLYVKGPKGELSLSLHPMMELELTESEIKVLRDGEESQKRALQGLTRSLIQNMVTGVSKGFVRRLEINGVGYRANVQGGKLVLSLGFSHPVEHKIPEGVEIKMDEEKKNVIIIQGIDKQKIGQEAAVIRGYRPPEPYKGKGVKYEEEVIRRKAGKTAGK